jgi:hypothetical protein
MTQCGPIESNSTGAPSPQSHAVPLSRILASQSPLRHAPVDGGLHAAPLSQILTSSSPLLDRPPASQSPLLQHRSTSTVRQNSRSSRTPPGPAQIPKRGPKRKAAAALKVNPDPLFVKSQKRHRHTNRYNTTCYTTRTTQPLLSLWRCSRPLLLSFSGAPAAPLSLPPALLSPSVAL